MFKCSLCLLITLPLNLVILTITEAGRGPLLDYSFGEVHFRKIGQIGLKASLGNPFSIASASSNSSSITISSTSASAPAHPDNSIFNVVRSIAIIWHSNTPIYVSLDVYVTVYSARRKQYSTSKISLQVENDEITYAVERKFLQAFNIECQATSPFDNLFVHKYRLPHSTKTIIFGLHNWTSFPKNRLFYPPATITYYGRSFTSFPLAEGVASRCRNADGGGDLSRYQSVEISGEFELTSKSGQLARIFAHADTMVDVSSYYAQMRQEARCHDSRCHPVYIDDATVAASSMGGDVAGAFAEFSCRPNAQSEVLEWWRCSDMGRQLVPSANNNNAGVPKFNVTVALGDYLVYCSEARFRDARALRWRWYNESSSRYEDFPLKGWRGSDTSCLWFTASLEGSITRRAYQCVESGNGKPVKEVYFEYNSGVIYTESCRFHTNGAMAANYNHNRQSQKPSVLNVTPGLAARAKITCHMRKRLNLLEGDDVNATSTYSVVRWDKTEATSNGPEFLLQSNYVEDMGQYHLHIAVDVETEIALKRYIGIYTLVLHFEKDVSQLVMQFRIRKGSLSPQQNDDGSDHLESSSPQNRLSSLAVIITISYAVILLYLR